MKRHFYFVAMTTIVLLLLSSCKKDDEVKDPSEVSGTIVDVLTQWTHVGVTFDLGETWAVTAPISNNRFTLKLPVPKAEYLEAVQSMVLEQVIDVIPEQIPAIIQEMLMTRILSVISIDEQNAKGRTALFYVQQDDKQELLTLIDANVLTPTTVQYMYVDNDLTVSGKLEETITTTVEGVSVQVPTKIDFDLEMKQGWNTILFTVRSFTSIDITVKSGNVPKSAVWKIVTKQDTPS